MRTCASASVGKLSQLGWQPSRAAATSVAARATLKNARDSTIGFRIIGNLDKGYFLEMPRDIPFLKTLGEAECYTTPGKYMEELRGRRAVRARETWQFA